MDTTSSVSLPSAVGMKLVWMVPLVWQDGAGVHGCIVLCSGVISIVGWFINDDLEQLVISSSCTRISYSCHSAKSHSVGTRSGLANLLVWARRSYGNFDRRCVTCDPHSISVPLFPVDLTSPQGPLLSKRTDGTL